MRLIVLVSIGLFAIILAGCCGDDCRAVSRDSASSTCGPSGCPDAQSRCPACPEYYQTSWSYYDRDVSSACVGCSNVSFNPRNRCACG